MIKKINILIIILLLIIIISPYVVNANSNNIEPEVKTTLQEFMKCLNNSDSNIYNYIDNSNLELCNNIEEYLNSVQIQYQITNTLKENDIYTIKTKIEASGIGWNVSGFTVQFNLKSINGKYKIVDTSLFDVIGSDNVMKFTMSIIRTVFTIIGVVFLVIGIIIATVIIIIVKNKKNKKE